MDPMYQIGSEGIHSLKLTVRTCQKRPKHKKKIIAQASMFRCKLAVSFGEGKCLKNQFEIVFFGKQAAILMILNYSLFVREA